MFPDQQNPNQGGQQPPQQPLQQPIYGANAGTPQQAYDSVPPPSITGRSTGHNPYEFIINPNTPSPKRGSLADPFIRRILLVVGGGIALLVVLVIGASLLKPADVITPQLITINAEQKELVRVATASTGTPTDLATKNLAANITTSVGTSQVQTLGYITTHGTKPTSKILITARNATTDQTLATALTTNTYDSALREALTTQLTTYNASLVKAYRSSPGPKLKVILVNSYNTCQLLLKQAAAASAQGQ